MMAHFIKLMYREHSTPKFEFDDDPDKLAFGLSAGHWLDPKRLPTSAHQTTNKQIPDIFPTPGLNAVSSSFRELVEEFEPGVHQFFPLALFHKNGEPVEGEFFIFNCTVSVDTLLVDRSEIRWVTRGGGSGEPYVSVHFNGTWVLSRPAIGGRHLWCGNRIRGGGSGVFLSDACHAALKQRKLKYYKEKYCEEVDEPWIAERNIKRQLDWEAERRARSNGSGWRLPDTPPQAAHKSRASSRLGDLIDDIPDGARRPPEPSPDPHSTVRTCRPPPNQDMWNLFLTDWPLPRPRASVRLLISRSHAPRTSRTAPLAALVVMAA
jgi:hypothetical protein